LWCRHQRSGNGSPPSRLTPSRACGTRSWPHSASRTGSTPTAEALAYGWEHRARLEFLGWTTVAEQYAGLLEDDLGVEITVEKIVNNTSNRLEHLRTDAASQDLLAEAEIVVVEPQPGVPASAAWTPYLAGDCGGDDGLACFHTAQADFELYVGGLFDELITLTPDKTTIVASLVGTWGVEAFNPTLVEDDPETHRLFVEHIVALQGISAAAAAERGIGSVDVSVAFSGPDYDEPVPDWYLEIDDTHLTDEGSRVVAELLHGLSTT
jgi:hypothetical protein